MFFSTSIILAINAGADQEIQLGEGAYLQAKAPDDLQLTWKINNDTYAYGKIFNFYPSVKGVYSIELFSSNNEHDSVVVTVVAKENVTVIPLPSSTIDAGVDKKIQLGESAYLKAKASDDLQLTWKINNNTYAYGKEFYFYPKTEGIFIIDLFASNNEHDSVTITVVDTLDTNTTKGPVIILNGDNPLNLTLGETYIELGAIAHDKDDGNISNKIHLLGNVDTSKVDTYSITYTVTNSVNKTTTITRKIIVSPIDANVTNTIIVTPTNGEVKEYISNSKNIIHNALEYAHFHGGGKVYLKAGTFFLDEQLIIFSDTTLEGEVKNNKLLTTIKLKDYVKWPGIYDGVSWAGNPPLIINSANREKMKDSIHVFNDTSNSNITIKNLIIDGNRENQRESNSAGNGCYPLVYFENVNNTHFSNVKMIDALSDEITIISGNNTIIESSTFQNSGHSAVMLIESSNSVIDNNIIYVSSNSGIRFFGGRDIHIKNNYIFSSIDEGNYGIQVSHAYSGGIIMDNVLIENNIIRHVPYAGIALYSSSNRDIASAIIRNNIIYQCGAKPENLALFPNTKHQEAGGINIQSFKSVKILNNTIFNNRGSAIWIDNRYYIPEDTQHNWDDLDSLDKLEKSAIIKNNILMGSLSEKKEAYGIEKRFTDYMGTKIIAENNLFFGNKSSAVSDNINISSTKNHLDTDPQFENASIHSNLKDIFYYPDVLDKEMNFKVNNIEYKNIGASNALIQKNNAFVKQYKELIKHMLQYRGR